LIEHDADAVGEYVGEVRKALDASSQVK